MQVCLHMCVCIYAVSVDALPFIKSIGVHMCVCFLFVSVWS